MSPSSNRKEPVLNVNDYSARHYPPENSQRPDSSDIDLSLIHISEPTRPY